ncbi:hypothetical protein [Oculatella sp. LEGE 06141]|uniref:hypothetical protein n=2 Tax=Oculatella sp. LEGE 06141 TaxID=1828648 RepID=UPI001D143F5F|nr:hypothetical protein [Oculatella sp. LEGE 06141]
MFSTMPDYSGDASLAELLQYSSTVLLRKRSTPLLRPHQDADQLSSANWCNDSVSELVSLDLLSEQPLADGYISYAAPLMPLRERDMKAMAELFDHDEIEAIEANITASLCNMLPEPCWDDDPFGFLKDYL